MIDVEGEKRDKSEILGEQVIEQQGSYIRVRRFLKGWDDKDGVYQWGWTGKETITEGTVIRPVGEVEIIK